MKTPNYTASMLVIAVDFDGTIVTHEYPRIGRDIPFAIDTLKKLQEELYLRLILWTVREGKELDEAVEYCRSKGLEFYAVNSNYPEEKPESGEPRKLKADLFIDDRNLGGLPDWGVIYRMITEGKHLSQEALIAQYTSSDFAEEQKRRKGFLKSLFG
jgi:hypothetical protein